VQRGGLAEVVPQGLQLQAGQVGHQLDHDLARVVGRAVVDHEDPAGGVEGRQLGRDPREQDPKVLGLVEGRHDYPHHGREGPPAR
jgi:hypothetical protein